MKMLLAILSALILTSNAQAQDTTVVYNINKTNELVKIGDHQYSYFYRDLKFIKETRELSFDSKEEVLKFFEKGYKALDTDIDLITKGYNLMRHNVSKNVLKVRNKDGGYFLLKRATIDKMKAAVEKQ